MFVKNEKARNEVLAFEWSWAILGSNLSFIMYFSLNPGRGIALAWTNRILTRWIWSVTNNIAGPRKFSG